MPPASTNVGGILHRLLLFAALPFIVSGGADVIEEPVDALPTQVTVTTSPSLNFRTSASHLVSSTVTSRWYSAKRRMSLGRPEPLLVGDAQVLVESVMNGIASTPTF